MTPGKRKELIAQMTSGSHLAAINMKSKNKYVIHTFNAKNATNGYNMELYTIYSRDGAVYVRAFSEFLEKFTIHQCLGDYEAGGTPLNETIRKLVLGSKPKKKAV
jgi:hypothetical protein